jgi:hypothetical protein
MDAAAEAAAPPPPADQPRAEAESEIIWWPSKELLSCTVGTSHLFGQEM